DRLGLHCQCPRADPGAGPRGRPFVRGCGDLERRDRRRERRRPRLRRRVRPGRRRAPGRGGGRVQGQRPVAELAFSEPSGPPAWKSMPAWAVVATGDTAAGTDVVRSMAERAGATITELEGSHVIMISQPDAVAEVITTAAAAVRSPA